MATRIGAVAWAGGGASLKRVPVATMIEAGMQHYALKLPQPERPSAAALGELDVPMLAVIAGQSAMHDPQAAIAMADRVAGTVVVYE